MGFWDTLSKFFIVKKKEARILCIGLDNSGKSTIMDHFKAKKDRRMDLAPTLGFSVERFKVSHIRFTAFDMSGQGRYRDLWEKYYASCDAIIFVLDSSDHLRIPVAKEELALILKHPAIEEKPYLPILFCANKCDLRGAIPSPKCAQLLELNLGMWKGNNIPDESVDVCRPWYICSTNAKTGEGLEDGIKWVSDQIMEAEEEDKKVRKKARAPAIDHS